jgi:septal ring-binding cell division protein DamX
MYAKYGFALMFVVSSALTFIAGLLAPDAWRDSAGRLAAPAVATVPAKPAAPATPAKPAVPAAPAKPAAAAPAPAAAVTPVDGQVPAGQAAVPLETLAVPVPAPAARAYALQAAQFASAGAADALVAGIRRQGMPSPAAIKAVDQGGRFWYVVAIGPYATLDEARAARAAAALRLQLPGALPAIVLPAAPAS